jgi:hypothetical protein
MTYAPLSRKTESAAPVPKSMDLRIGEPDDSFEQEADRVAEEIAAGGRLHWSLSRAGADAPLQRKCACGGSGECEECKEKKILQRKADGPAKVAYAPPIVNEVLRSPGQALDPEARAFLEPRFGYDFGRVRIHTDTKAAQSARSVDAKAFTVRNHIVFAGGRFAPSTLEGRRLLAHELAHVVQPGGPDAPVRRDKESGFSTSAFSTREPLGLPTGGFRSATYQGDFKLVLVGASCPGCHDRGHKIVLRTITTREELLAWASEMVYQGRNVEGLINELQSPVFEASQEDRQRAVGMLRASREDIVEYAGFRHLGEETAQKAKQKAEWVERGKRAAPIKGATLLMPEEAREMELVGRTSPPVQHASGKWYQYGMTVGRFKVILPDDFGGGIVEVKDTGYYYELPEREFRDLFWIVGIKDKVYQASKGINVAYGYALKAAGEIANFTQIGRLGGPMLSTAGEGLLYDVRRTDAIQAGDEFTEPAPEIGVRTIVQTASNVIGAHVGGKIEAATGSGLAGTFAGAYAGGMVQKGYEAVRDERSWGSVFTPPSPEEILTGWAEGKVGGYVHRGWTQGRAPVGGSSEATPAPLRPEQAFTPGKSPVAGEPSPLHDTRTVDDPARSKASAGASENALRNEVEKAAEKAGSQLKLGDGVHGMAAAGEGKAAGIEFCSPGCSLAARKLGKAAHDLSKNPLAKKRNSEVAKLVKYLRDTQQQIETADDLLRNRKITKKQANTLSAQIAGELRKYAGRYPELDRLLQDDPKVDLKVARDVERAFVEYRGPAAKGGTPMRPEHAKGYQGEQRMGFERYNTAAGWKLITGPGGSAGHRVTQKGEDALAYNPKKDRLELADNKSFAPNKDPNKNEVSSATAIDPEKNLLRNVGKLIDHVRGMKGLFPEKRRVLELLNATRDALEKGKKIPKNVRLVVTNFGGASDRVSQRLADAGVVFEDAGD